LEQSFTACMPLLMVASTFRFWLRCWSYPEQCHIPDNRTICCMTTYKHCNQFLKWQRPVFCRFPFRVEFLISGLLMAFMLDCPSTIQIFRVLKQCLTLDISAEIRSRSFSSQRYAPHSHTSCLSNSYFQVILISHLEQMKTSYPLQRGPASSSLGLEKMHTVNIM